MDKPLSQERLRIRITSHSGVNWYKDADIGNEFDVTEVRENTYLVNTGEPYELGVSKSHCKIISGSVPQERLSELESAILFAKLSRLMGGDVIVSEKCIGEIQWAIAEVKRLQAIEAESFDLYKSALEIIAESEDEWYVGTISHRQYARNILNKGVDSNESN